MLWWARTVVYGLEVSVEDVFEAREDALAVGVGGLDVGRVFHSLECAFLVGSELLGDVDHDVDELVALAAVLLVGQSLSAEAQHLAGLCSGGDVDAGASADGGYLDGTAEGSRGDVEHEVVDDVGTVADELGVLYLLDDNEKVAGNTSALGVVALAAEREGLSLDSSGGYGESDFLVAALDALTVAVCAWFRDNLARTLTLGADRLGLHGAEHGLLYGDDTSGAVALRTCGKGYAVLGACTLAVGALEEGGYAEGFGYAAGDVLEG